MKPPPIDEGSGFFLIFSYYKKQSNKNHSNICLNNGTFKFRKYFFANNYKFNKYKRVLSFVFPEGMVHISLVHCSFAQTEHRTRHIESLSQLNICRIELNK